MWEGKLAAAKECVSTLQSEVKQAPLQLGSLTTRIASHRSPFYPLSMNEEKTSNLGKNNVLLVAIFSLSEV